MKKLISLIASLSLAATMVAPAFAAEIANNAPVFETSFVELTASEFENDWVGEALPEGEKAYLVDVNVTGLDLENASAGKTNVLKKKRTGVLFMYGGYEIVFDSTDNVGAVYTMDGLAGGSTVEKTVKSVFLATKATEAHPVISDGTGATPATDAFLYQFVITTSGTVTGTVKGEAKVSAISSDSVTATQDYTDALANISYTVNGEATNAIVFGATEEPPVEDDTLKIEISDPMAITAGDVNGIAWDVAFKNFDSTLTYTAHFSSNGVERNPEGQWIEFDIETEADFGFAAILNKVQLGAEDTVDFVIKY